MVINEKLPLVAKNIRAAISSDLKEFHLKADNLTIFDFENKNNILSLREKGLLILNILNQE